MKLNLQASHRQQQASDPSASAWVNANAGSGKTHVLVDRVIRLMLAGTAPSRILCLTFTKAAAAEMAIRIFDRLSGWIWLDDVALRDRLAGIGVKDADGALLQRARQLFALAQETPGGLKIQTIHAFCERLLQLFPVEAGVVPHFTVMDDRTAAEMLAAARDSTLIEAVTHPESVAGRALAIISSHAQADNLDQLLREMMGIKGAVRASIASAKGRAACLDVLRASLGLDAGESAATVLASLAIDRAAYDRMAIASAKGTKTDIDRSVLITQVLATPDATLLDLEALLFTKAGEPRSLKSVPTAAVHAAHGWVRPFLADEQQRLDAALSRLGDLERLDATEALFIFAARAAELYETRKRALGFYDFDDLITRTSGLLHERPDAAWVLYKLDGGIDHVLLDEAQDTSPAQWDIVRSLTGEFFAGAGGHRGGARTMFAVGDRKQSIYSFQGADPNVFEAMHDDFKTRISGAGQPFSDVDFTVSFRSAPEVLQAVDMVFHETSPARKGLDGRSAATLVHQTNRPGDKGVVEIWPLVEPDEREEDDPWTAPVDREPANAPSRKLARRIASDIKSWIGTRTIGNSQRAVQPQDILILVRKRSTFFDAMISELRNAGVPVAGADRLQLGENIAVLDLVALASFCVLPDDDYSLACVLKSPVVAPPLSEDDLFQLAHGRELRPLWQALEAADCTVFRAARHDLARWLELARTQRPFEFFAAVLQSCRSRIVARLGSEADDALDAFLQAALDFEHDHTPSLAAFITWFQSGEIEIKRNMEQGAGEVRIMTVHGAKGLEAPIVILPDTTSAPDHRNQPQLLKVRAGNTGLEIPFWCVPGCRDSTGVGSLKQAGLDAQAEEYRRLLYVAMTRARDELYVCGYRGKADPKPDCWYNLVHDALAKDMRELADGKGWRLGADPGAAAAAVTAPPSAAALPDWATAPVAAAPPAPVAVAVTGIAARSAGMPAGPDPARMRGIVVHRLLQVLPEAPAEARLALGQQIAAKAGLPSELADEVLALLETPELAWLFTADGIPEVTLSARSEKQGLTVSGRIDRLVVGADAVIIADFKTDRQVPASPSTVPATYLRQMALYRQVMAEAYPGRKVEAVLVWTSGPQVMKLPEDLLEAAMRELQAGRP